MSDIILKADSLSKHYGQYKALDELSVEIPRGSIFGLLGPNGAGKTTFLRLINQILIPSSGTIYVNGEPLNKKHISQIGYMPEERGLYKNLTVMDQAMYLAQLKGMSTSQARERVKKWLNRFEIESWSNKKIQELSKGMAQKVQFIITVLHEPEFMILDEPFSGFDPINAELIRAEIEQMCANGTTILFSTHRMESVEQMCSHILLLNKGREVLSGKLSDVKQQYKQGIYKVQLAGNDSPLADMSEFVSWEEDQRSGQKTALMRVQDISNPNDLLQKISSLGQVNCFAEQVPSINDIFISKVESSNNSNL